MTRMDVTTPYTMAQSTVLEPTGPPHSDDESPFVEYQTTAAILKRVVAEQNGNTIPTGPTVLELLELRAHGRHI